MYNPKEEWRGNSNNAIAIIRRSSPGQKNNTTEESQDKDVEIYVENKKLVIVKIFSIIESAKDSALRKKFHEAMDWANQNKIRHRIFYKADRETRNLTDNENGERDIRQDKYVIHHVQEQKILHKNSPDSDFLMRDYQAVQNKHYSRDLKTKIGRALLQKAESGWFPSQAPPWGYINQHQKNDNGFERKRGTIIVIDPSWKTAVAKREFELRRPEDPSQPEKCRSLLKIREIIVSEGLIPADQVSSYHTGSIERRLKYVFYDDRFDWNGVEYPGKHERLISKELFWAVQSTFGHKNPYRKSDGIFGGGWLKCAPPNCGCKITYEGKPKTQKATGEIKIHRYYHCTNGKKIHKGLKGLITTEEKIWEQFGTVVDSLSLPETLAQEIASELNAGINQCKTTFTKEAKSLEETIATLEQEHVHLYQDYRHGVIKAAFFKSQYEALERKILSHQQLLEKHRNKSSFAEFEENVKSTFELAKNAKLLWNSRVPEERKQLLEMLLSNRKLDGVNVQYDWKKPFQILLEMKTDPKWRILNELNFFNNLFY